MGAETCGGSKIGAGLMLTRFVKRDDAPLKKARARHFGLASLFFLRF
jgi:hypothetical protein